MYIFVMKIINHQEFEIMEKPPTTKSINKILKLLPKVSQAAVSFQNPHSFSPRSDHHHHHKRLNSSNLNKGFSGTIIPHIPNQRSSKNNYENTQEPTSPKVSCMGQVKHKHKMCKQQQKKIQSQKKALTKSVSYLNPQQIKPTEPRADSKKKKQPVGMGKLFGSSRVRKSDASTVGEYSEPCVPDRAPSLSQMRRFASSRDALADFDWTIARDGSDDDDDDDDDVVIIPFSAPLTVTKHVGTCGGDGDLEPRKEINLWKRRTTAQPKPLRLDILRSRSNE